MSPSEKLVILFGGADREQTVLRLHRQPAVEVAGVIVPQEQHGRLRASIKRLTDAGLPLTAVHGKKDLAAKLQPFAGIILLSIGFPYLIAPSDLDRFKLCLNLHPSLLPDYRGPTSTALMLKNNESVTGATVHVMDAGMDTGPIVLQHKIKLTRFDTVRSVLNKTYAVEPDLMLAALRRINTPGFQPQPQPETGKGCLTRRRTPADSEIDPGKPLLQLFDSIRACDPQNYPAHFYVEGQTVCIKLWRPDRPEEDDPQSL